MDIDEFGFTEKDEISVHLICPNCGAQYEMSEFAVGETRPTCPQCDFPLLRSEENHKNFLCLRCIHRIIVPDGIWCRQFNCAATTRMATACRSFSSRSKQKTKR